MERQLESPKELLENASEQSADYLVSKRASSILSAYSAESQKEKRKSIEAMKKENRKSQESLSLEEKRKSLEIAKEFEKMDSGKGSIQSTDKAAVPQTPEPSIKNRLIEKDNKMTPKLDMYKKYVLDLTLSSPSNLQFSNTESNNWFAEERGRMESREKWLAGLDLAV